MKSELLIDLQADSKDAPLDAMQRAMQLTWQTVELAKETSAHEVTLKLASSDEIQALNNRFRQKDKPTNVLSFPSPPIPGIPDHHLGDMVICVKVVQQEAHEQQIDVIGHWIHLAIHGLLHLMGYDHESDDEAAVMQGLEIELLKQLGWANPYQDC